MSDVRYIDEFGVKDYSSDRKTDLTINPSQLPGTEITVTFPSSTGTPVTGTAEAYTSLANSTNGSLTNTTGFGTIYYNIGLMGPLGFIEFVVTLATPTSTLTSCTIDLSSDLDGHGPATSAGAIVYNKITGLHDMCAVLDSDGILTFDSVGGPGTPASFIIQGTTGTELSRIYWVAQ